MSAHLTMLRRALAPGLAAVLALPLTATTARAAEPSGHDERARAYACRQDIHPQDPDYPGVHVASLEKAPNGDLLYSFYAGTEEGADDVATYMSRLPVGARTWTEPRVIFDEPGQPDGNAVLWADGRSTYLFFSTIRGDGWTEADLRLIRSRDSGRTWSEPEQIRQEFGWLFGTRPFRMSNGEVLVPIYSEARWASGWYIPGDDYSTWVPHPSGDDADWPRSPNGAIQPATVELEPGHLLAYLRTRDQEIYRTESFDYGRTWSAAEPTGLPNNNARVALLKLRDGALVLAFNPITDGRDTLRLALSTDQGRTWSSSVDVESEPGAEFSYPYLLQTDDGMIHLGYTHRRESMRHLVFNEQFVRAGADLPSDARPVPVEYRNGRLGHPSACAYRNRSR
ncbi:hypothetical protein GBF35_40500 [Nonomuraea phyllanthi]|uniref:sialidase family protein n=1 Tax=Nonomuraea phyllanthi TaxID=2219224 RepID=UPI0012938CD5|nr:sialidase family protein [Nonomuraea phyllanthi]QFY12024.1 hypothetical protein GBF35_40500 [Nonomuraea phyllanthi]